MPSPTNPADTPPAAQAEPPVRERPLPDLLQVERVERGMWTRIGLLLAAAVLFLLGVVVWLIPVLGGSILLYIPALLLVGMASRRAAAKINQVERKLPRRLRLWLRPRRFRKAQIDALRRQRHAAGATDDNPPEA